VAARHFASLIASGNLWAITALCAIRPGASWCTVSKIM